MLLGDFRCAVFVLVGAGGVRAPVLECIVMLKYWVVVDFSNAI